MVFGRTNRIHDSVIKMGNMPSATQTSQEMNLYIEGKCL